MTESAESKHARPRSTNGSAAELYIDLLKRSLTNTIFEAEPDIDDDEFRFTMDRVAHYVNTTAVSMLPLARFENMRECVDHILADNVPGDLIETGVWRGGAVIFMRALLKVHGVTDRIVWGQIRSKAFLSPIRISFRSRLM
jgi:Macrocin-O-methyltransferase (TylF)